MAFPLVAAVVGMQIAGNMMSNFAQADAELQNAKFYQKQAEFTRLAGKRQEMIAKRNYSYLKGQQLGVAASQGVDTSSGSMVGLIADTLANEVLEIEAIQKQVELDVDLAMTRSRQAGSKAALMRDPLFNILQAGPSLLSLAGD